MIDSNSNHQTSEINRSMVLMYNQTGGEDVRKSYSSATMVKRRHPEKNMDVNLINIDFEGNGDDFIDGNNHHHHQNDYLDANNILPIADQQQKYNDITDVQVIAKIQEDG